MLKEKWRKQKLMKMIWNIPLNIPNSAKKIFVEEKEMVASQKEQIFKKVVKIVWNIPQKNSKQWWLCKKYFWKKSENNISTSKEKLMN